MSSIVTAFEEIHMKGRFVALFVAGALASAAYAQSVSERTGVNAALGITPKTEDFIKEAAMSDMLEIEAAKIAQEKGNADIKKFAAQMIADHTKTSSELKELVPPESKAALPTELDSSGQKKIDKLRDIREQAFGPEFYRQQVSAHKEAVDLFERYAKGGKDPKLKDWAGRTLHALRRHLEMAEALDNRRK
jgi:putative membrane protein